MCDRTTLKIISHRGNIKGPQPDKENRPSYIDCAIGNGYQVEIDKCPSEERRRMMYR